MDRRSRIVVPGGFHSTVRMVSKKGGYVARNCLSATVKTPLMNYVLIPSDANIDPYDGSNSSADKARLDGRYGSSFERRNAARWANLGHRMPDFRGFWTSLRSARGTSTKSPIAPRQNPRKLRSYGSILASLGITKAFQEFLSLYLRAHEIDPVRIPMCVEMTWQG
jgi:hypothetical protein